MGKGDNRVKSVSMICKFFFALVTRACSLSYLSKKLAKQSDQISFTVLL